MSTEAAPQPRPVLVHRQLSLTLPAFDVLKAWQRHWETSDGRRVTNSEALSRLILSAPLP